MSLHVIDRQIIVYPPSTERLTGDERQTYASCRVVSERGPQLISEYYLPEGEAPRAVVLTNRNGQTHILTSRTPDYLVTQYSRLPKKEAKRQLLETTKYSFIPGFGDSPYAHIATKGGQSIVDGEIVGTFVDWGKNVVAQREREINILTNIVQLVSDPVARQYLRRSIDWLSSQTPLEQIISTRRLVLDFMRDNRLEIPISTAIESEGAIEVKGIDMPLDEINLSNANSEITVSFLEDSYLYTAAADVLTTVVGGNEVRPFANPQYIAVVSSQGFSQDQIELHGTFPNSANPSAYMNLADTAVKGINNGLGLYAINNRKDSGMSVVRYTGFQPVEYQTQTGVLVAPQIDDGTDDVLPLLNETLQFMNKMKYKSGFVLAGKNLFEGK